MDSYNGVTPMPGLPRHLNPYAGQDIGRHTPFNRTPSPLRQSLVPCDYQTIQECPMDVDAVGSSYPVFNVGSSTTSPNVSPRRSPRLSKKPKAATTSAHSTNIDVVYPKNAQRALEAFNNSIAFAHESASKGKLSMHNKKVVLEHINLCIDTVAYHRENVKMELKYKSNHTELKAVVRLKEVLEAEVIAMKAQRDAVIELPINLEYRSSH